MKWKKGKVDRAVNCPEQNFKKTSNAYLSPCGNFAVCKHGQLTGRQTQKEVKTWICIHVKTGLSIRQCSAMTMKECRERVEKIAVRPGLWSFGEFNNAGLTTRQLKTRSAFVYKALEGE